MKKAVRTLSLLLALAFLLSTAVFADEAETDTSYDSLILGTWQASVLARSGEYYSIEKEMPLIFNEDHTGTFDYMGNVQPITWSYSGSNESSHYFTVDITVPEGDVYHQLFGYIYNYENMTGTACFMLGETLSIFYIR